MSMSYGRRARLSVLPAQTSLSDALGRIERLGLPVAIVALFAYPNPFVLVALLVIGASAGVRLLSGRLRLSAPVDAWLLLLFVGTGVGFLVSHSPNAAWVRLTGLVGAVATFGAIR